jgi:hypothetical protein
MAAWFNRHGRVPKVTAGAVVVALVALAPSAFGSSPAGRGPGASWSSSRPASSVSTTMYVSAVDCAKVHKGAYSGQESGLELFGRYNGRFGPIYPSDFAGVYTYCHGKTQVYAARFVTADPGAGVYRFYAARFRVAPGDPLKLSITSGVTGVKLKITDANTRESSTRNGPAIGPGTGWSAGTDPIYGGISGAPYLKGTAAIVEQYTPTGGPATIAGPVPFPPVVFDDLGLNGQLPGNEPNHSIWHGHFGTPSVTATPLSARGDFTTALIDVKKPKLGVSEDIAPVTGTVSIELPGKDTFAPLTGVSQIPDGSQINANGGYVQVTLGLKHGKSETGVFYDGQFHLHQSMDGGATASLTGGSFAGCSHHPQATTANAHGAVIAQAASAGKKKRKKVTALWANAHGNFTTQGSAGSAAVLGTRWYTEETCGGTYFKVLRDKIKVTVYYPQRHTVIVTAGHSLFAPDKWDDGAEPTCGNPIHPPCLLLLPAPKLARGRTRASISP